MPITQIRVGALIAAAEDYRRAYLSLQAEIRGAIKIVESEPEQAKEQLLYLGSWFAAEDMKQWSHAAGETLAAESVHYRHTSRRNKKRREKRQLERGGAHALNSPDTLVETAETKFIRREAAEALRGDGKPPSNQPYVISPEAKKDLDDEAEQLLREFGPDSTPEEVPEPNMIPDSGGGVFPLIEDEVEEEDRRLRPSEYDQEQKSFEAKED